MKKENLLPRWYIATTIIGSEESIYTSLLDKIKAYRFNDLVKEMKIIKYNDITIETFKDGVNPPPKSMRNSKNITWETTPDGRYIKKTAKIFNKFPGYLFICMVMTEEVWYAIRNTPGITGFVGSSGKGAKPIPISEFELQELFDPEKNKDIIRHVNASSVSIEEVDHVEEENPIKSISDVEFFNSRATTSTNLSQTRKIDFETRNNKVIKNDLNDKVFSESKEILNNDISDMEEKNEVKNEQSTKLNDEPKVIKDEPKIIKDEPKIKVVNDNKKIEKDNDISLGEFLVGNTIKIIDGSFKGEEAIIIKIDNENKIIICQLDFFGRNMEVKLQKDQIEK